MPESAKENAKDFAPAPEYVTLEKYDATVTELTNAINTLADRLEAVENNEAIKRFK